MVSADIDDNLFDDEEPIDLPGQAEEGLEEVTDDALAPLDGHVQILPGEGKGGGGPGSRYAYSAILRDQAEFHSDASWDVLRDYTPEGDMAKLVVYRLANIITELIRAPGSSRMLQWQNAKARADMWKREIRGEGKEDEIKAADLWLKRWGQSSAVIASIRRRRLQYGLPAVNNADDKLRYYSAELKQGEIRRQVVRLLQPETLQYFTARLEMYIIQSKMEEEAALGYPSADYSSLLSDADKGKHLRLSRLMVQLPDFFPRVINWCIGHPDPENPYRKWMQNMIAGVGASGNPGGRGMFGFGRRRQQRPGQNGGEPEGGFEE